MLIIHVNINLMHSYFPIMWVVFTQRIHQTDFLGGEKLSSNDSSKSSAAILVNMGEVIVVVKSLTGLLTLAKRLAASYKLSSDSGNKVTKPVVLVIRK